MTLSRTCTTSGLAGCRKRPRWCGLDCAFPACNLQCRTPSCSRRCGSASLSRVISVETVASLCTWISLALWMSLATSDVNLPSARTILRAVSARHAPTVMFLMKSSVSRYNDEEEVSLVCGRLFRSHHLHSQLLPLALRVERKREGRSVQALYLIVIRAHDTVLVSSEPDSSGGASS